MKLLYVLHQLKSEQVPLHVYIKSPTGNLYLGNNGKMETEKVVFEVEKKTKNGLVTQTLYNIEDDKPLRFKYMKSENNEVNYVPQDQSNVTFNYVDLTTKKAKVMIGEAKCLIRSKDNSVSVKTCSHSPTNQNEIFIIGEDEPKVKKKSKQVNNEHSDVDSNLSEIIEQQHTTKKDIPHNVDNEKEYTDSTNERLDDVSSEYSRVSDRIEAREIPKQRPQIRKRKNLQVKHKTHSSKVSEDMDTSNQKLTTSQAYSPNNSSPEFTTVIEKLQDTISALIEKLNSKSNKKEEANTPYAEEYAPNHNSWNKTDSDIGFDPSYLTHLNAYMDKMDPNSGGYNDYHKKYSGIGDYNTQGPDRFRTNTHTDSIDSVSSNRDNLKEHISDHLEDIYRTKLGKMKDQGNKILNLIRDIQPGNIEKISLELKNLLDRIKNIRLEYIQNAQNKANEYLMSLSNLSTKIINLENYLKNIKANPNNFFSTMTSPNQVPGSLDI